MTRENDARATDGPVHDHDRFGLTESATNGSSSRSEAQRTAVPGRPSGSKTRMSGPPRARADSSVRTPGRSPTPWLRGSAARVTPARRAHSTEPLSTATSGPAAAPGRSHDQPGTRRDLAYRYPTAALEPAAALFGWLCIAVARGCRFRHKDRRPHDLGRVPMVGGVPRRVRGEHPSRCPTEKRAGRAPASFRLAAQISTRLCH